MAAFFNPVTCVLVGACVVLAMSTGRPAREPMQAYGAWLQRPLVTGTLASLAAVHVAARIVLGVVAPGDFAGEIVAARAWTRGAPLYSADIGTDSRAVVDAPADRVAASIAGLLPPAALAAVHERRHTRLVAQAHPPTLLAAIVPVVAIAGPSSAFALLAVATLLAAGWSGFRLASLGGAPRGWATLGVVLASGWQPVLAALRDGQLSVVVGALCVGAWWRTRERRGASGGALVGCAGALKLYPLLLVLPLGLASWRGAVAAVVAFALAVGAATAFAGAGAWAGFVAAAASVTFGHARSYDSLSLLARIGALTSSQALAFASWAIVGTALVGVTLRAGMRRDGDDPGSSFDLSFAGFCCLAVVLSPVAWHHYAFMLALPLVFAWTRAWRRGDRAGLWLVLAVGLLLSLPAAETSGIGSLVFSGILPGMAVLRTGAVMALWWVLVGTRRPETARTISLT